MKSGYSGVVGLEVVEFRSGGPKGKGPGGLKGGVSYKPKGGVNGGGNEGGGPKPKRVLGYQGTGGQQVEGPVGVAYYPGESVRSSIYPGVLKMVQFL